MRLIYSADLHGQPGLYQTLLTLAHTQHAQALIVGGDLLPRSIRLADGLAVQQAFVQEQLAPLLAESRRTGPGLAIYLLPGNDDWAAAFAAVADLASTGLLQPLHEQVVQLAPWLWLAGYGCVPLTPYSIKDYERRDDGPLPPFSFDMAYQSWGGALGPASAASVAALPSIAEALASLAQQSNPAHTVYVCHAPPYGTALDQARSGKHLGSRALRAFIEQHQPPLTLHGHVHEAPAMSGQFAIQIGRTWCVNPGHDERRFQAVIIDIDQHGVQLEHTVYGRPH